MISGLMWLSLPLFEWLQSSLETLPFYASSLRRFEFCSFAGYLDQNL